MMLRALLPFTIALTLLLSLPSQANAVLVSAPPKTQVPAFSNDASESRIGLLCHNDPVNRSDPFGLIVETDDDQTKKNMDALHDMNDNNRRAIEANRSLGFPDRGWND